MQPPPPNGNPKDERRHLSHLNRGSTPVRTMDMTPLRVQAAGRWVTPVAIQCSCKECQTCQCTARSQRCATATPGTGVQWLGGGRPPHQLRHARVMRQSASRKLGTVIPHDHSIVLWQCPCVACKIGRPCTPKLHNSLPPRSITCHLHPKP